VSKPVIPRLDVLPAAQKRLWTELGDVSGGFILYGGTALALQLGHRTSIDFDFFAHTAIDPGQVLRDCPFLKGAQVIQQAPNTLTCLVDRRGPVKVSFFGLPHLTLLRDPAKAIDTGVEIASLIDLAATKAVAVQNRLEAKDYIDIDALISAGVSLSSALGAAKRAFGGHFAPMATLKALSYFGEGELCHLPQALKDRLTTAVGIVDVSELPRIARSVSRGRRT
jgi:hypothetical protein